MSNVTVPWVLTTRSFATRAFQFACVCLTGKWCFSTRAMLANVNVAPVSAMIVAVNGLTLRMLVYDDVFLDRQTREAYVVVRSHVSA
jgi:hypothetical protein